MQKCGTDVEDDNVYVETLTDDLIDDLSSSNEEESDFGDNLINI